MASSNSDQIIGKSYTIGAEGGYSIQQTFPEIPISDDFFVQDALQIRIGADFLNQKIGIFKDPKNENILEINYDTSNNKYTNDTITITANELVNMINTTNIISMGSLSTLYSDFNYTVLEYFGAPYGFSSLFSGEEFYNINNGVFDASALIHIINGNSFDFAGAYVSDLSGAVILENVTEIINQTTINNSFNNRPEDKGFSFKDGFIENDLIYVQSGFSVKLTVDVETEPYITKFNVGPQYLNAIDASYNTLNYTDSITLAKKETTSTTSNITQIYTVPILFVVSNVSDYNIDSFGVVFDEIVDQNLDDINWLSCSISASGKFQVAVEEFGDIFSSTDYGATWSITSNIGNASTNCISMSFSGQYQTASNGNNIFVSSDYGTTWTETYSIGSNEVFVCICLTGKYQLVISAGDSFYRSDNYGQSWIRYNNENSDIFNSIATFPSAGVTMSYDGKYQTIVSENIYRSDDYGGTWNTTNIVTDAYGAWDDHNWYGVDMSSDGKYQVAIEIVGEVYISSDYGIEWGKVDIPIVTDIMWQAISISANGQSMTGVAKNGSIYYSTDYGVTWNKNPNPELDNKEWRCVSVSSNSQYQLAGVYGGGLYVSRLVQ